MNEWQKKIKFLNDKGMNQSAIARECDCARASISLIANGDRTDITYKIGHRIDELCSNLGMKA